MKKMLMLATVPSMIGQFNMNNIDTLLTLGYEVHVACNFNDRTVWTTERVEQFKELLRERKVEWKQIDFARNPLNIKATAIAKKQLNKLVREEKYDFVHCHTPAAGLVARQVCHKNKVKVIYTAHGFHFYEGAPIQNWLIFYPVEKFYSKWTDVLITINQEDLRLAEKKFAAKKTAYIPGVGVDIKKFDTEMSREQRKCIRDSLGVPEEALLIASVGELNANKNHQIIVKAIACCNDANIHYIIVGKGDGGEGLKALANNVGIENQIHILGFRTDIAELYAASDICAFPSIREGLGLAALEAMASGLPIVVSNNRGAKDFAVDGENAFVCGAFEEKAFSDAINKLKDASLRNKFGKKNSEIAEKFSTEKTNSIMREIYTNI